MPASRRRPSAEPVARTSQGALCTCKSLRRKPQHGATSVGRPALPESVEGARRKGSVGRCGDRSRRPWQVRGCHDALVEPDSHDASRRTYLAEERTLLAWWRSGLAAFAVAIGVGRLLPALLDDEGKAPFVALGVAYAILGLAFVVFGSFLERAQAKALAEGGFAPLSR